MKIHCAAIVSVKMQVIHLDSNLKSLMEFDNVR